MTTVVTVSSPWAHGGHLFSHGCRSTQAIYTTFSLCRVLVAFTHHLLAFTWHGIIIHMSQCQWSNPGECLSWWRYQMENKNQRYWPFVRGIHWSPVNSPHKGQWCGSLMFSLICAWTNGWVNNRDAGDLRRHGAHYDATVMVFVVMYWLFYPYQSWLLPLCNSGWYVQISAYMDLLGWFIQQQKTQQNRLHIRWDRMYFSISQGSLCITVTW